MDNFIEVKELYEKSRKYLEEESKNDPETEPYRSKYIAMGYLKSIKEKLEENPSENNKGMLSVIFLQMGIISVDTEEIPTGEQYLTKCLEIIPAENDKKYILIALTARNHLGILWCQRLEINKAKDYLEACEELYNSFTEQGLMDNVMSLHDHFDCSNEMNEGATCNEIEQVHTLTKFYLAQIYGKLGDNLKSAIYCHETLRRQLESKQYDSIDWALNSATLSQYFMEKGLFTQARHHLAAASYILDKYEDALKVKDLPEEEMEAKKEELKHRGADVSRCWAKYGIFLLEQSKHEEEIVVDHLVKLKECWFPSLELAVYESQMPDSLLVDFDGARDVMLVTQKLLNSAKEYYCLEDHASDYAQLVQDQSTLLRHLSHFEKDEVRLCKMIKKRINMLEDLLKELNPQYYLNVCRGAWFELGEAYHDIMHIKQERLRENDGLPNPAALNKANHLSECSISNFKRFIDSVKGKQTELPDVLPDDLLRPTLVAHFYLGRLHYKLITPDKRQALKNTYEAFCCFKYLVGYCNNHQESKKIVEAEYQVSEEMMNLLELKIKQSSNIIA